MVEQEYLTIGEVVRRLGAAFPDLRVSKLRYLEDEGLVNPARTPSGYRKYGPLDLERVELILTMQRDQFLPLQVIKDRLAELDVETGVADESSPQETDEPDAPGAVALIKLSEVAARYRVSEPFIKELAEYRLIQIVVTRRGPALDSADADVVEIAARMQALGFDPRHLRIYATFAQREADLYAPLLTPTFRHKTPESKALLATRLAEMGEQLDALRHLLFWRAVREEFRDLL